MNPASLPKFSKRPSKRASGPPSSGLGSAVRPVWSRTSQVGSAAPPPRSKTKKKQSPGGPRGLKHSLGGIDGIDNRAGDEACDKAAADVLHELVRRAACPVANPPTHNLRPYSILSPEIIPMRATNRETNLQNQKARTQPDATIFAMTGHFKTPPMLPWPLWSSQSRSS